MKGRGGSGKGADVNKGSDAWAGRKGLSKKILDGRNIPRDYGI